MKSGFLDNMAPNAQRSFLVTLLLAGAATAIYMFGVLPAESSLARATEERTAAQAEKKRIDDCIKTSEKRQKQLKEIERELAVFQEGLLEKKVGSYSTRATELIAPIARGCGLKVIKYEDEPVARRLPLPNPKQTKLPAQLHVRVGVKVTAVGSFQKAVSFLLQLERQYPLLSLASLRIAQKNGDDLEQDIEMVFEWPAFNTVPEPVETNRKKGGK